MRGEELFQPLTSEYEKTGLLLLRQTGFRVKLLGLLHVFLGLVKTHVVNQELNRISRAVLGSFFTPVAAYGGIEDQVKGRPEGIARPIRVICGIQVDGLYQLVVHHQLDAVLIPLHDVDMEMVGKIVDLHRAAA